MILDNDSCYYQCMSKDHDMNIRDLPEGYPFDETDIPDIHVVIRDLGDAPGNAPRRKVHTPRREDLQETSCTVRQTVH